MKKWILVMIIVVVLLLSVLGLSFKAKSDIESAFNSNYAVLFLDDAYKVDFVVAGDITMFDDVEKNAIDNKMEKDGVSIYDCISKLGIDDGSKKIKDILRDKNMPIDKVILVKDTIMELVYPTEKISIDGNVPIEMKKEDVISLFKGEIDSIMLPVNSLQGVYYTSYTNITEDLLKSLPPTSVSFQIPLKDIQTQKTYNVFIYGSDLETLCISGVLKKTFIVKNSVVDIYGNIITITVKMPATVTLGDIAKYPVNDFLTINQHRSYHVEVDSKKMIAILRDSKNIDIDTQGNYKIKAWILHQFPEKEVDKDFIFKIIKKYKEDSIQILPSNFTLRLIKYMPDPILRFLIDRFFTYTYQPKHSFHKGMFG